MSSEVKAAIVGGILGMLVASGGWGIAWWKHMTPEGGAIRAEQLQALGRYAVLTEVIRKHSLAYLNSYRSDYLRRKSEGKSTEDVAKELQDETRQLIHDEGQVLETGNAMKSSFPNLKVDGKGWDEISKERRKSFTDFLLTVSNHAAGGNDPASDTGVKQQQQALVDERQKILAACRELLVK